MTKLFIRCIRFYQQYISKYLPSRCKYYPTCSNYAIDALETHSFNQAIALITKRLLRCHPFSHHHFFDPVPNKKYDMNKVHQIMIDNLNK